MGILALIPARGGSKGIPKKNLRLMNGKPLIAYAIENAKKSKYIRDVFVTTDSKEIEEVSKLYGAAVIKRDNELSSDLVTLDPVIYHAMLKAEKETGKFYDAVITLQPTSPLLNVETLDSAIEYFISGNFETVISVVNKPHLAWGVKDSELVPLYSERKNRQELTPQYLETGAFVISKRNVVVPESRIGSKTSVYEISEVESIDIDDRNDWLLAETLLKRKKIIFRVEGHLKLGLGHIYNCLTLAFSMMEHDVLLVISKNSREGIEKIKASNLPYRIIESDADIDALINEFKPDIWVNDCLDTDEKYIRHLKSIIPRVISIEDLGSGIKEADAVINALYDDVQQTNVYSGWEYVCLRDEFQIESPNIFKQEVSKVLIMFGGTDPANLNKTLYEIILKITDKYKNIKFEFITGLGYKNKENGVVTREEKNIFVYPDVPRVTKYMREADLAITSQGRTIFELAAMRIPAIVLSQNEREQTHFFAQMENGFLNLGVGAKVDSVLIENTLEWLVSTAIVRKNMYEIMGKYDLRKGLKRVKNIILGEDYE
ncbi:MAG: glycosyltransferase [Phascolarctobacterium faecium]|uniref:cytidylyltransferase domain-containing protein n=1 Tax=Phascolarctobacterium faecium TaxID=33025 RepID=UPI002E79C39F|nr:glycosyltransferase [Phascolarctobacterium faecium]MED9991268.1 glycosyltransferase [Phascolarctobacterium faecium]